MGQVVADIDGSYYTSSLTERKKPIQIERNAIATKSKKYTNKYCSLLPLTQYQFQYRIASPCKTVLVPNKHNPCHIQ